MGRSTGKVFFRIFIRSFFVVVALLLTGVLSYKAAMIFWQPDNKDKNSETAYQENTSLGGVVKSDKYGISRNLIYCYDEETNEITKLVLEIFDIEAHKLTYITIPAKTQLTLSVNLYQKLILDDPEIPQVLKLSTITRYLDGDKAFQDEVLITEELLGVDINYYTAIPKETFDLIYKDTEIKLKDGFDPVPKETFTGAYKKEVKALSSKNKIKSYLKEFYPELHSNLSLEDKLDFTDSYSEMSLNDVSFELLPGENHNTAYIMDHDRTEQLLKELSGID